LNRLGRRLPQPLPLAGEVGAKRRVGLSPLGESLRGYTPTPPSLASGRGSAPPSWQHPNPISSCFWLQMRSSSMDRRRQWISLTYRGTSSSALSDVGRRFFHIRRLCDLRGTAPERRIHRLILRSQRPQKKLPNQCLSDQQRRIARPGLSPAPHPHRGVLTRGGV
jgi:hypothetical protein